MNLAAALTEVIKLLDLLSVSEQAQARALIDARYPSPVSLIGGAHGGPSRASGEPGSNGANAPNEPRVHQVHEPAAPPKAAKTVGSSSVHAPVLDKVVGSFLQFWAAYPRKTGKQEALRVWKKLNPDAALQEKILAAVRQQKTSADWCKDDGQFIPHPKTWLNQGRWDDEPMVHRGSLASRLWREGSPHAQP